MKSFKEWCVASSLTHNRIEQLLGQIIGGGLRGDSDQEDTSSNLSVSTYLFSQSDDESLQSPGVSPTWMRKTSRSVCCAPSQATLTECGPGPGQVNRATSTESLEANSADTPAQPIPTLMLNGRLLSRRSTRPPNQSNSNLRSNEDYESNMCDDADLKRQRVRCQTTSPAKPARCVPTWPDDGLAGSLMLCPPMVFEQKW